ncbi:MAG: hypothetical protein RBT38_01265 [Bacteroidales bacterium]|jgi:hypothetical protein|nr:hypothetical protein [Bacteroidales bacterium]
MKKLPMPAFASVLTVVKSLFSQKGAIKGAVTPPVDGGDPSP